MPLSLDSAGGCCYRFFSGQKSKKKRWSELTLPFISHSKFLRLARNQTVHSLTFRLPCRSYSRSTTSASFKMPKAK
ncbi:hypothetical protein T07_220 [Trichinella nelsoni]|uniref:Uncharacterized protein n=1 Tax=Trichinella nelsoni TaxID=6336 RepID=A0A0V0RD90_9BILA|nr:hypothetical protein T07_220 [Trichinella nelsoni]